MKVVITRTRIVCTVAAPIPNAESIELLRILAIRADVRYQNGRCVLIQPENSQDTTNWHEFMRMYWEGNQYTIDELADMLAEIREVGVSFDEKVMLDRPEPSLLPEPSIPP
jgi:hypothetical protein